MVAIPYVVAYALATLLSMAVTWRAIQARPRQGAQWLAVAMGGVTWWSLMKFAETFLVGQASVRLVFNALHWIGVGAVSIGVLGFGLSLTGRNHWLTPVRIAALSAVAALPVLAWLGDPRVVELLLTDANAPTPIVSALETVESTWPWLRWVSLLYLWSLVALGSVFILETALERPKLDPSRGLLGIMVAVPWVINLLYEFDVITNTEFDPTVLGFVVTGVAGIATIDRFRLFDVPFARSQIVEQFETPILVYGPDNRLYDYNEQAAGILDLTPEDLDTDVREVLVGSGLSIGNQVLKNDGDFATYLNGTRVSIPSGDGNDHRQFLVQVSALGDETVQGISYGIQLTDLTDQYRQRERIRRERNLNEMIRNILVQLSSRRDIERAFCEQLADGDRYTDVWIGERSGSGDLIVRTYAGEDGDGAVSDVDNTTDLSTATARTALETDELTINQGALHGQSSNDDNHRSESDMQVVAALPLTYNELTYGVLVTRTSRTDAFDSKEQRLLTDLSESIAFAINAVEQREALQGETVREVVIRIQDPSHYLVSAINSGPVAEVDATIEVYELGSDSRADSERSPDAHATDDGHLQFITVSGGAVDPVVDYITSHDDIQSATVLTDSTEAMSLRVRVQPPTLGSLLTEAGGAVQTIYVGDGAVEAVAEFSLRTDMNRVLEHIRGVYPDATVVSLVTKESTTVRAEPFGFESLTDKQREALEAAYHSGFFERPQRQTAGEIAQELGVSRSTFLRHVRTAENKLLTALLTRSHPDQMK